jgi:TolB-like protein
MSSDPEQEYFSDGLTEELLNLLSRIPELRVTSRSSSFFYKGKDFQISDVGQALGVGHVLEGSVRRSGETIRITAQLIEVNSDIHIWSNTWDRKFEDVFAIQDEIAAAVVDALKISMLGEAPRVAETTPEAYALYLQGRSFYARRNADGTRQAAKLLERALEIDNQYAPAWVLFGEIHRVGSTIGAWEPHEGYPLARSAAFEALRLDEDNAYAHLLLSRIAERYDYDIETARKEIEFALALAPGDNNIRANAALISMMSGVGVEDTATLRQEAIAGDPLNLVLRTSLGFSYLYTDRIEEAVAVFREIISLNPEVAGARFRPFPPVSI